MTQQELDAIPEMGGLDYQDNSDGTRTPFMRETKVLYQPDDESMMVTDSQGQSWMLGWVDKVRYKRRIG